MKCADIQNQIPEYLEDMVSEEMRVKIHAHLSDCSLCREHASRLSSLSGDFKKMAQAPIPFDLAGAVKENLSQEVPAVSFGAGKAAVFLLVFLCLAGFFKIAYEKRSVKKISAVENQKLDDTQASAILEKLKQTEAGLQRGAGAAGAKALNRHRVASLAPFHWQLRFASVSEREVFTAQLKRVNPQEAFRSEYFLAFSMDQSYLKDLMTFIENSPAAVMEGPKIDIKSLPQSEAPLQITLLMEIEGNRDALCWLRLRFLRHDSYLFTQRLHEAGFKFLFETRHFVLLRLSPLEYQTLQAAMKNTPGLEAVKGGGSDSFAEKSQESFPALLFLQED